LCEGALLVVDVLTRVSVRAENDRRRGFSDIGGTTNFSDDEEQQEHKPRRPTGETPRRAAPRRAPGRGTMKRHKQPSSF
jgi:hypothetical protein